MSTDRLSDREIGELAGRIDVGPTPEEIAATTAEFDLAMKRRKNGPKPRRRQTVNHDDSEERWATDLGNADRLVALRGRDMLWVEPWKTWVTWAEKWGEMRWGRDSSRRAWEMAEEAVIFILVEAAEEGDEDRRMALAKWALRSQSEPHIRAMLELAKHKLPARPERFDPNPFFLCCANGVIDLENGVLRDHAREQMITKTTAVCYDPSARSAVWQQVLREALPDEESIEFLQRAAGYSATGDVSEEKLFLVLGPEASAKSTVLEAIKTALGEYAMTADFDAFTQRPADGSPRNDLARLHGARFVSASEGDDGRSLGHGLVKLLTGGDRISARFLYAEAFEFVPTFKLWLASNHAPRVRDDDPAMWRRIVRIPFENTIPKERRDPKIKAFLRDPTGGGPAVLAWVVQGAIAWQKDGLGTSRAIEDATSSYRADMDPLRGFFEERCLLGESQMTPARELRGAYEDWARGEGIRDVFLLSPRVFAERLRAKGCRVEHRRSGHVWLGIGLRFPANGEVR